MQSLKVEFKRARPALGTILLIRIQADPTDEANVDLVMTKTFELVEELEQKFSKFSEMSDISRLNQVPKQRSIPVSREFCQLLPTVFQIWQKSQGAFDPFLGTCDLAVAAPIEFTEERGSFRAHKTCELKIDLSGIAKGYIVDLLHQHLRIALPHCSGVINAGGDIRFLNDMDRKVEIRLETTPLRLIPLQLNHESVATSSLQLAQPESPSSTLYPQKPRVELKNDFTVTALASSCGVADGLTKVGWFGEPEMIQQCVDFWGAEIIIFSTQGQIFEKFKAK